MWNLGFAVLFLILLCIFRWMDSKTLKAIKQAQDNLDPIILCTEVH